MVKLKPCPWCKQVPRVQLTDYEGNFHDEDYLKNPYSGVGYVIVHTDPSGKCPIANDEDVQIGRIIYDSVEQAVEAWNSQG